MKQRVPRLWNFLERQIVSDKFRRGYQFHGREFTVSRPYEHDLFLRRRGRKVFALRFPLRGSCSTCECSTCTRGTRNELRSRSISMDIKGLDHFVKYCEIFVVISVSFRIFYKEMKAEGNLGFLIYNFYSKWKNKWLRTTKVVTFTTAQEKEVKW